MQGYIVEMMQDPTMKKIVKKVFRFGTDFTLNILKAVSAY